MLCSYRMTLYSDYVAQQINSLRSIQVRKPKAAQKSKIETKRKRKKEGDRKVGGKKRNKESTKKKKE